VGKQPCQAVSEIDAPVYDNRDARSSPVDAPRSSRAEDRPSERNRPVSGSYSKIWRSRFAVTRFAMPGV
jgi:hypothetical protein